MKSEKALLAAGCFWHVEESFSKIRGVVKTRVGYSGGNTKNPSYAQVSSEKTGHAETIEVIFNPNEINYREILEIFWGVHDPTSLNRQGLDIGTNYRSAIFYLSEKQKKDAEESKKEIQKEFRKPIVTEIKKAGEFFAAEEYHQKYFEKKRRGF